MTSIRETKDLPDEAINTLKDAMGRFRRTFEVTGGKLLVSDDEAVTPLGAGEVDQAAVAKYSQQPEGDHSADSAKPDNLTGGE